MSKIEWTDKTWNPVTGCTKISEGCQNCYAEKMHKRLQAMDFQTGKNPKYRKDFSWVKSHTSELNTDFGKKPKMIFVNSMADLFHKDVPDEFIVDTISTCHCHHRHTFQILTKRSERLNYFNFEQIVPGVLPNNIWLGVSVELAKYKHRIDDLRKTNAKVKFISFEPLCDVGELDLSGIDWVIVGGESGPGARPMHPDWVRNIRDQALAQGCKFMFKQWGEWKPVCSFYQENDDIVDVWQDAVLDDNALLLDTEGCSEYLGDHISAYQPPDKSWIMRKVGKKKAGCLLDGKEYKEYPNVSC